MLLMWRIVVLELNFTVFFLKPQTRIFIFPSYLKDYLLDKIILARNFFFFTSCRIWLFTVFWPVAFVLRTSTYFDNIWKTILVRLFSCTQKNLLKSL